MRELWADRRCRMVLSLLAAAIVWQCFVPPIVGLADNGDFYVVFLPFGLTPASPATGDERYFGYLVTDYYFAGVKPEARLFTTEWLLFLPGFLLTPLLSKVNHYDLRLAGLTHALLYITAFALLLPYLVRCGRWWLAAVALLIAWDVHYVCYFNSLYTDVASLLFLLLSVAFYVRLGSGAGSGRRDAALLLVCLILFIGSKAQHAILMVPLAAFAVWKRALFWPLPGAAVHAAAAAILLLGVVCLRWTPPEYRMIPFYTTVFQGLLPYHPDPKSLLSDIGLPEDLAGFAGTNAYMPGSGMAFAEARQRFERSVSWPRLISYYARHPVHAWRRLRAGLQDGAALRPSWGNFTKDAGYAPNGHSSGFATWSDFRIRTFLEEPEWFLVYIVVITAGAVFLAAQAGAVWRDGTLLLAAIAWIELLVATLADALETTRHLFLFNTLLDLLLLIVLAGLARLWTNRSKPAAALV